MNTLSTLKNRVIAFSTLITLGVALIGVAVFHKQASSLIQQTITKSTPLNPALDELKKQYQTEFKQEEQVLMQEFFTMTEIDGQDWSEYKQTLIPQFVEFNGNLQEKLINDCPQPLPDTIISRVQELMKKTDLDARKIAIIGNKDYLGQDAIMCAGGSFIVINEPKLEANQFSALDIDAMLLHEMHHLLYEDYLNKSLMYMFIHQHRSDLALTKEWTSFHRKWNHFMEKRVDISVGLLAKDYCQSRLNCAPAEQASENSPSKATHVAYMSKLLKQLEQLENHATQSDGN